MDGNPENNLSPDFALEQDNIPFASEEKRRLWSLAARYAEGLPALSASIFQLNDLLSQSVPDLSAIVRVLYSDPSMSAQVLSLAASLCEVEEETTYRLDECVVLAGSSRLRSLVLTTPLIPTDYSTVTMFQALCHHCDLTSRLCRRIAHVCGHPEPHKAHIAGLLHDIGALPVFLEQRDCGEDYGDEKRDHCAVGSRLARYWKLPAFLIDVIEHHHEPEKARCDRFLTVLTSIADDVSRAFGVGWQVEPAAHVASDCTTVLDRRLTFVSPEQRRELAGILQREFLDWVKPPLVMNSADGPSEGKWKQWQSAL